jgi:serine/threonine protein kinase
MLLDIESGRVRTIGIFYKATELLGSGRFAEVYKAFDSLSQTEVALKIYREADEKALSMAKQENEVLRSLSTFNTGYFPEARRFLKTYISNRNHPVIVQEIGYYIASSKKHVIRLKDILSHKDGKAENRLPEFWRHDNLYPWIIELCGAVVIMHKNDIIHRDLKPDNILLKKGAGLEHSVPFILDFNTSVRSELKSSFGGTEHYLPPEVRSGKRTEAVIADDLWALATLIGEMFLGVGQKVAEDAKPQQFLFSPFPEALLEVLMKALAPDPTARFLTADEFLKAIETVLTPTKLEKKPGLIGLDELSWARQSSERIRNLIIDELSGDNELPIPKDVRELVAVLYSSISEENTRSFDIKDDIVYLGPRAIPPVLENAYKVHPESKDYDEIVIALVELAHKDLKLLERSISYYCMSSSFSVRSMCRTLCDRIGIFPEALFELLSQDNGLLLANERVDLADLCIRYSKDSNAILALSTYMCREYILDTNRYHDLRQMVANRMGEIQFDRKALLIVQDATGHIWEDLEEFEKVREGNRFSMERGLLQLFGDAFAAMGDEALKLFENGQVPSRCGQNKHYIFRLFARKLAASHRPAKQWLSKKFEKEPNNRDLSYALRRSQNTSLSEEEVRESFARYIQDGSNSDRQKLCRPDANLVFELIREQLRISNDNLILKRLLDLLKFFEYLCRPRVVDIVLQFWEDLSNVNYETLVDVLVSHKVPREHFDTALNCLQRGLQPDMATKHGANARRGLNILLKPRT